MWLLAYAESAELTPACSELARPTPQLARPTASTTCPESAWLTSQSAKPISSIPVVVEVLPDDLTPLVDWFLEMKNNIIQIKNMHFSSLISEA
jgi:hypothetical protein